MARAGPHYIMESNRLEMTERPSKQLRGENNCWTTFRCNHRLNRELNEWGASQSPLLKTITRSV